MDKSDEPTKYICEICDKSFKEKETLYQHHSLIHLQIYPYKCQQCPNKQYKFKYELTRHLTRHKPLDRRLKCSYQSCQEYMKNHKSLREHLQGAHGCTVNEDKLCFRSLEDFYKWKTQLETDQKAIYVRDNSTKNLNNNTQRLFYYCHRTYLLHPKTILKQKAQDGRTCPSMMVVTVSKVAVEVDYFSTHVGHKCEMERINLSFQARSKVQGVCPEILKFHKKCLQLNNKVPNTKPLSEVVINQCEELLNLVSNIEKCKASELIRLLDDTLEIANKEN